MEAAVQSEMTRWIQEVVQCASITVVEDRFIYDQVVQNLPAADADVGAFERHIAASKTPRHSALTQDEPGRFSAAAIDGVPIGNLRHFDRVQITAFRLSDTSSTVIFFIASRQQAQASREPHPKTVVPL